ncbi:MAG: helix-turn-helix domain-containing protein [Chloroflexi bacterium]|nr:helix-turn-helix domain-containing protein [Chloroflexota bacterium]
MTYRKIIGILIRAARERMGKPLKTCATVIGRTPDAFRKIEAGTNEISVTELSDLSRFLGVPIEYFFSEDVTLTDEDTARFRLSQATDQQALIGKRLREARRQAGLKQKDLASALGCSARMISQYEQGKRVLSAGHAVQLLEILDLSLPQLLPDETLAAQYQISSFPDDVRQFILNAENLPYLQAAMRLQQVATSDLQRLAAILEEIVEATSPATTEGADDAT